jgi:hypothetical protein
LPIRLRQGTTRRIEAAKNQAIGEFGHPGGHARDVCGVVLAIRIGGDDAFDIRTHRKDVPDSGLERRSFSQVFRMPQQVDSGDPRAGRERLVIERAAASRDREALKRISAAAHDLSKG